MRTLYGLQFLQSQWNLVAQSISGKISAQKIESTKDCDSLASLPLVNVEFGAQNPQFPQKPTKFMHVVQNSVRQRYLS